MEIFQFIKIDDNSRIPKYRQIVDSIILNISIGNLKMNQKIPSINMFSEEFLLSRDTVEKAYNVLKEKKVISPVRGKGYYITRTELMSKTNVIFFINKLSTYKMAIYNSFVNALVGEKIHTELRIYHCEESLFLSLLDKNFGAFDYYVIMPHFTASNLGHLNHTEKVIEAIKKIPKEKLLIMDNKLESLKECSQIYQDFENDMFDALNKGLKKISKYNKLILVFPTDKIYPYPIGILKGFKRFCVRQGKDFEILGNIYEDTIIKKNDLFIVVKESDLVSLMHQIRDRKFQLSKDIGIISCNDTPLKELLGITVVSTNFKAMGEAAAKLMLSRKIVEAKNPYDLIDRNSM